MRTVVELLLWWSVLLLLNTVLISSVTPLETAVGGGIALLAAVGALTLARTPPGTATGGLTRAARALWAFPGTLLADTWRLLLAVASPAHRTEGFREVRPAPGTGPAWAAALLSATPGAIVVSVSAEDGTLTVHTLGRERSALERALTGEGR